MSDKSKSKTVKLLACGQCHGTGQEVGAIVTVSLGQRQANPKVCNKCNGNGIAGYEEYDEQIKSVINIIARQILGQYICQAGGLSMEIMGRESPKLSDPSDG